MNFNEKTAIAHIAAMFHFRDSVSGMLDNESNARLFISYNFYSFNHFCIN